MTGQFKILPDSCCELTETFFLFMYLPGARELGFQKWMCFLGKVVSCRLWGCGSVLCHLNEWLLILPCLCFSSSVCICTLNFLERPLAYLLFSVRLCTILHTMTPRWWNTGHKSLYSSRFFLAQKVHAYTLHGFTYIADVQTNLHKPHACRHAWAHPQMRKYVQAHLESTHSQKHIQTQTPILRSPCGFFLHLVRVGDPDCSSCSQQRGVHTHYYVWHHFCFHQVWILNQTHPRFSTSILSSLPPLPPPPPPLCLPTPFLPFSQIWSLSTPLLCPTPPTHLPPNHPSTSTSLLFFSSVLFLLFFLCKKCFKFIICILWCMGTIMFFIMEKWERFIFVTGLFHNSFFKLVL